MKVSIIIPTYKPDYYIWECLKSLENQTISKKNYEIIIILNGKKEPYYLEISEYIKKNNIENIRIIYTEISGVSNARNLGLDKVKGKYIVFLDDDDFVEEEYLEELLYSIEKNGENGIIITNYIDFDEKTRKELFRTNYKNMFYTENLLKMRKTFSVVWGKLIPKKVIEDIKFKDFSNGEDSLFMAEISKNIEYIATVENNTLYRRRVRKASANFKRKKLSYILTNCIKLLKEYLNLFFRKGYSKKFIFLRMLAVIKGHISQIRV